MNISLVGIYGYRAPPGNIFLIGVSILENIRTKRLAMLTSWQNVPRAIFMQINDAITENCILRYISVNDSPCFDG